MPVLPQILKISLFEVETKRYCAKIIEGPLDLSVIVISFH